MQYEVGEYAECIAVLEYFRKIRERMQKCTANNHATARWRRTEHPIGAQADLGTEAPYDHTTFANIKRG